MRIRKIKEAGSHLVKIQLWLLEEWILFHDTSQRALQVHVLSSLVHLGQIRLNMDGLHRHRLLYAHSSLTADSSSFKETFIWRLMQQSGRSGLFKQHNCFNTRLLIRAGHTLGLLIKLWTRPSIKDMGARRPAVWKGADVCGDVNTNGSRPRAE